MGKRPAASQQSQYFTGHDVIGAAAAGYDPNGLLSEAVSSQQYAPMGYVFQPLEETEQDQQQAGQ